MNDGKRLEALVAFVEEKMLPKGYSVKTNRRVYNDEGVQIAEFDVEIRGKLGTTEMAWLIECRDRPGSGPAPSSWIEQLVGRRARFGFNKITAVSTTGFAEGAQDFANKEGIELRVVEALEPGSFSWLLMEHVSFLESKAILERATFLVDKNTPEDMQGALRKLLEKANGGGELLRSPKTGRRHSVTEVFLAAVHDANFSEEVKPNSQGKRIKLHAKYIDEDNFFLDTELGPIRVDEIVFYGELSIVHTLVPINVATKYSNLETGETISQVIEFESKNIRGIPMALELHRMGEDGATYVSLRKKGADG